jgi:hypothetical protein
VDQRCPSGHHNGKNQQQGHGQADGIVQEIGDSEHDGQHERDQRAGGCEAPHDSWGRTCWGGAEWRAVRFLSIESGGASDRLASIAVDRPRITEALAHFAWGTRQYLLVTTVFGLIVAVLDWIALAILGIPLATTWALLSFITNYIPNVGFIIGVVPPALLGLLTAGPQLMLIVIVVYCVLNFVVQSIIQPRRGRAVGHGHVCCPRVLDVADRPAWGHSGHPAHAVEQGAARGRRSAGPLGRRAAAGIG